jgi:hypothetical protein
MFEILQGGSVFGSIFVSLEDLVQCHVLYSTQITIAGGIMVPCDPKPHSSSSLFGYNTINLSELDSDSLLSPNQAKGNTN